VALSEQLENEGRWLFRRRSYMPLVFVALLLVSLPYYAHPDRSRAMVGAWEVICVIVSLSGLAVRVLTIGCAPRGTSGRRTKRQVADTLNTTGTYSVVRHPLYLGNYVIGLGIALFLHIWWLPLFYTLAFALAYERIMLFEERFLRTKFGKAYHEWAAATPAFFPRFSQWKPPDLPLSLRTVIKKEYHSLFGIILYMWVLKILSENWGNDGFRLDPVWTGIFVACGVLYLVIRLLRKKTSLFDLKGR
jgi:protein-S-isoprenylcysteine O-methyltransferase Ste14